jgi:hypothetical protein
MLINQTVDKSRLSEYSPPIKNYLPPVHGVSKHPAQLYQTPGSNYLPGKELLQAKPSYHPGKGVLIVIIILMNIYSRLNFSKAA